MELQDERSKWLRAQYGSHLAATLCIYYSDSENRVKVCNSYNPSINQPSVNYTIYMHVQSIISHLMTLKQTTMSP